MIRVSLYSPQPVLLAGIERLLEKIEGFEIVSSSADLDHLMGRVLELRPSVILLDSSTNVSLPVLRDLMATCRGSNVILWMDSITTEFALQAIQLGVRGILRSSLPLDLHIKCMRSVGMGEMWVEKGLTDKLLNSQRISLTPRERQLMLLLSHGLKNKEVAYRLGVTEGTVKVYLSRLFDKLGVSDRFELALFAIRNLGVVPLTDAQDGTEFHAPYLPKIVSREIARGATC